MHFLDEAKIRVRGGDGGRGSVAFRREKFVPRGGPAGGDGGDGGDVYLVGKEGLNTLYHLRFRQLYAAERGRHGEGSRKTGRSGEDLLVEVPPGTQARDAETGELIGEVLRDGDRLPVARGGLGGRGNARFASATRQAPRHAEPGRPGEERTLELELKLLADVGVVGLPNAGKSTLIRRISAARPKVADYPFTTLVPQLGVVATGPLAEPFVVADLPGLIAGAASGAGLGIRFLKHVERCRVLLHLVDLAGSLEEGGEADGAAPGAGAVVDLETIEAELEAFDPDLLARPRLLVGSKLDAADPDRRRALAEAAAERGLEYREMSSASGRGVDALVARLSELLGEIPEPEPEPSEPDEAAVSAARLYGPADAGATAADARAPEEAGEPERGEGSLGEPGKAREEGGPSESRGSGGGSEPADPGRTPGSSEDPRA